jgi:hypothetical protein
MHIVTGASQNHFKSLCQFLNSLQTAHLMNTHVWDFGISAESLAHLEVSFKNKGVRIHRFPFEEYPDYFAIEKEAGQYAWKPVAIYLTALEVREGVLLWCDAGNRRDGPLENVRIVIRSQGVYSPISAGTAAKPQAKPQAKIDRRPKSATRKRQKPSASGAQRR